MLCACYFPGDGNEDVSCALSRPNMEVPVKSDGSFTAKASEDFFLSLRTHFISFLVFPSTFVLNTSFLISVGNVPPIIQPLVAGSVLHNTEHKKDSSVLKNIDALFGNQMKLCELLLSGELVLSNLDGMTDDELVVLCKKLEFQSLTRLVF